MFHDIIICEPENTQEFCAWQPDPNRSFQFLRTCTKLQKEYWIFYGDRAIGTCHENYNKWIAYYSRNLKYSPPLPTLRTCGEWLLEHGIHGGAQIEPDTV